ncbi:MbeD/MobD family mobilization/exclusion protein, partial [Klebsiella pneumoniae]|uniref:MbeD/MobD family mobilization/exclusion protein n=1 Tax=Klebsiella pneumoniae TaxID=573 RepID=UPI0012B8E513
MEKQLLTALEQLHPDYSQRLDEWASASAEWPKMSGLMQRENAARNEPLRLQDRREANVLSLNTTRPPR